MALPRKKVREARRDKAVAIQVAKEEKKVAIQQAKQESRVENILAGDSFGQKLGGAITDFASSASTSLGSAFAQQVGAVEPVPEAIAVPPTVNTGSSSSLPLPLILAAVALLGFLAYSGKLRV